MPQSVVAVDTREDATDVQLFPEEQMAVARAVDARWRAYATARACARDALARLGLPPSPILNGRLNEPLWPSGVVGSITHCDGYRACALARETDVASIGIDGEPHAALPPGILATIARPEEAVWLHALKRDVPSVYWCRLLWCAKEAVFKTWFPLGRRMLEFEHTIVSVDPGSETFTAQLLVSAPSLVGGPPLTTLAGRWLVSEGLLLTAIVLEAPRKSARQQ